MHETMTSLKGSVQPPMTLMVLGLMGMLPAALQAPAIDVFSRKGSAVISNVPGPQAPLLMCGQRISEMYFWVPQSGTIGVGISILSYAGKVFFGMISDRNLVSNPGAVMAQVGPEFGKAPPGGNTHPGGKTPLGGKRRSGRKPRSVRKARPPSK
jgi:hypothetical protein